jgi:MFS family permease
MITSGLVGQGLGPPLVGLLSDHWTPAYGDDALRYALAAALGASVWAGLHGLLAARTLERDRFTVDDA